jgi:hypothetical protein
MPSNDEAGITIASHKTFKERLAAAQNCCSALDMQVPLLIDGIDDAVGNQYSGHPDRLYVIDSAGKVAYKGGRGPFGFIPGELEQNLTMLLLAEQAQREAKAAQSTSDAAESATDAEQKNQPDN